MTSPSSPVDTIEKALEGVTPGPWQVHQTVIHGVAYGGHWVEVADEDQLIQISGSGGARSYTQRVFDTQGHDDNEANARYVAACSPDRMREVLNLARQAEAMKLELAEKDARIAVLEEALKPFADHRTADGIDGPGSLLHIPDEHPLLFNGLGSDLRVTVTVGDVRRARAFIGGGNAE